MTEKKEKKTAGHSYGKPNAFWLLKRRVRKLEDKIKRMEDVFANFIDGNAFFKFQEKPSTKQASRQKANQKEGL